MRATFAFGASAVAVLLTSCSLFVDLDGLEDGGVCATCDEAGADSASTDANANGDARPPIEASTDGGPDGGEGGCPSGKGPKMVSAGTFCIDSTETTQHEYNDFFNTTGGAAGVVTRPAECAWKTTTSVGCGGGDAYPVACVDWCDAYAYCAWTGKRLCGALGDGSSLPYPLAGDRASSEWSKACSPTGDAFPYGASYQDGVCNTQYLDGGGPSGAVPAASRTSCVGGVPGLFDMGGNLEEWLNSCDTHDGGTPGDTCHEGGDCFDYHQTGLGRCDNADDDYRNFAGSDVGIRCCASP